MNLQRLHEILGDTCIQLRKGETIERTTIGDLSVTNINAMPHVDRLVEVDGFEKIDLHFIVIGVDTVLAKKRRDELIAILNEYPDPDRLALGPSYIEVGADIGDQGAAFQLFALGKVLGLWDIITPASLGFDGDFAAEAAGRGFIMITGYKKDQPHARA
jgi:hypothetical protein